MYKILNKNINILHRKHQPHIGINVQVKRYQRHCTHNEGDMRSAHPITFVSGLLITKQNLTLCASLFINLSVVDTFSKSIRNRQQIILI